MAHYSQERKKELACDGADANSGDLRAYIEAGIKAQDAVKEEPQEPEDSLVVKGEVFTRAERALKSLHSLASRREGRAYRAYRQLERMKAEREKAKAQDSVIDVEEPDVVEVPESVEAKRAETQQDSKTDEGAGVIQIPAEKRKRLRPN